MNIVLVYTELLYCYDQYSQVDDIKRFTTISIVDMHPLFYKNEFKTTSSYAPHILDKEFFYHW